MSIDDCFTKYNFNLYTRNSNDKVDILNGTYSTSPESIKGRIVRKVNAITLIIKGREFKTNIIFVSQESIDAGSKITDSVNREYLVIGIKTEANDFNNLNAYVVQEK